MTHLCITVRWLDDRYHGLLARLGPPEWPPSPFRLFQALVAGVARSGKLYTTAESLLWLESLSAPLIIAPRARPGKIVQRFVPNNDGDKLPDRQGRLTGKISRSTILLDPPAIHYVWNIPGAGSEAQGAIEASRCLSCFGWGIDMAFGDGRLLDDEQIGNLSGVRWFPKPGTFREDGLLRVPTGGTITDLVRAHKSFLGRIELGEPLHAVDKPRTFDRVFYASVERPLGRPCVVFALRKVNDDFYGYAHAKLIHIAGMTRRASIQAMENFGPAGVAETWISSFVAGHRAEGENEHQQLSYLPLPSIGHEHADGIIRRVMVAAPFGTDVYLHHLADQLDGVQLQPEGRDERPILIQQRSDGVVRQYLGPSTKWASVTPVILPGHDDHKRVKTMKLIEKALLQSGIEQRCQFTWSALPNFKNCLSASKHSGKSAGYFRPNHLEALTATHIRITFDRPVSGPLSVGAGRHCGLGVLATIAEK